MSIRTPRRGVRLGAAGAVLAVLPLLYFVDPNTTSVPLCPLHSVTGLWCPLCGSTRAGYALLHADPGTALHDNALFVTALPILAVFFWWRRGRPATSTPPALIWTALVVALTFGIARNLAFGSWLAPPG